MTRHIHLDLLGGIAGDMFLAAAIDAELIDVDALQEGLRTLGLGDVSIVTRRVRRGAIAGTHVHFEDWDSDAESDHRHLSTILQMIGESELPAGVKARAATLFETLGRSESKIHDIPVEKVHFHEVGAIDSILDMTSAAWVIEEVDATWSAGPIPSGRGTIETAHGTIPVPAPATADLLEGFDMVQLDVDGELVTPTGATILRELQPQDSRRQGRLAATGYGAGTKEFEGVSNVVRLMVFEEAAPGELDVERDTVLRFQTEIDDATPEELAYVEKRCFAVGALDVTREPVHMKKGRLGTRITVLSLPKIRENILRALFFETSTLGIRVEEIERFKLHRTMAKVDTEFGPIRIKIATMDGAVLKVAPEYEDCAAAAERDHVALREVYKAALEAFE